MSTTALALLFLSLGAEARCDMVEVNHYIPEGGSGFTQIIAWDWDCQYCRWNAQQWVIVQDWCRSGDILRTRSDGKAIEIRFRFFRETWTVYDPERENQRLFDARYRRRVW